MTIKPKDSRYERGTTRGQVKADEEHGNLGDYQGKPRKTTIPDKKLPCPMDKVNRQFRVPTPNMLWVSDFTYVATWKTETKAA